jgi:hypothetical protein
MNSLSKFSILVLVAMLMPVSVMAEGEKLREKLSKGAITVSADIKGCDADMNKYCSGLSSDSDKTIMCMMAYEHKLSDTCKAGIVEAAMSVETGKAAISYAVSACEADADKLCLNVKPGEGKIIACLKKNQAKVSKACVSAMDETGLWGMGAK